MWGMSERDFRGVGITLGCLVFFIVGALAIGLWELGRWILHHFHWSWS